MQLTDADDEDGQGKLLSLRLALARVDRMATTIGREQRAEKIPLAQARGRILAQDIRATQDVPNFANSAVDGFAFAFKSLQKNKPTKLKVVDEIPAGQSPTKTLALGQASQIYTGAPMPRGADTIVMEEDAKLCDNIVVIPNGLIKGANRRASGDDIRKNTLLMKKGKRINIVDCAAIASLGLEEIEVFTRLRVVLFSSGAELARGGGRLKPAQIFDSNATMLRNWLQALGCEVFDGGILQDNPNSIENAFKKISKNGKNTASDDHLDKNYRCDLIIASGGMSKSRLDYVARYCHSQKPEQGAFSFWRIAMKPGRPIGVGRIKNIPFAGLPGNPVASFLTFALIVQPLIQRLNGQKVEKPKRFTAKLGFKGKKKKNRVEFVRVKIVKPTYELENKLGLPILKKNGKSGAAVLSSVIDADGFAELDEKITNYEVGELVTFIPMREIFPSC